MGFFKAYQKFVCYYNQGRNVKGDYLLMEIIGWDYLPLDIIGWDGVTE